MSSGLRVVVTRVSPNLRASTSLVCGIGGFRYLPLLVNEGYLYVMQNGKPVQLFVKKR
jgi:hypothetical protein